MHRLFYSSHSIIRNDMIEMTWKFRQGCSSFEKVKETRPGSSSCSRRKGSWCWQMAQRPRPHGVNGAETRQGKPHLTVMEKPARWHGSNNNWSECRLSPHQGRVPGAGRRCCKNGQGELKTHSNLYPGFYSGGVVKGVRSGGLMMWSLIWWQDGKERSEGEKLVAGPGVEEPVMNMEETGLGIPDPGRGLLCGLPHWRLYWGKGEIIITSRLPCAGNDFGLSMYRWEVNGNDGRLRGRT